MAGVSDDEGPAKGDDGVSTATRDDSEAAAGGADGETTADDDKDEDDEERGWLDKVVDVVLEIADLV